MSRGLGPRENKRMNHEYTLSVEEARLQRQRDSSWREAAELRQQRDAARAVARELHQELYDDAFDEREKKHPWLKEQG